MFKKNTAKYKVYKDDKGEWRWTYYANNGEAIAVSGEGYNRKVDCLHGVTLIKASKDDEVEIED